MNSYADLVRRGIARHGERFDTCELLPAFRRWYESGDRVRVRYTYTDGTHEDSTGTIGVTTGWRPAFLLMHSVRSHGSSYVIGSHDRVIAVKVGRKYVEVHQ